MKPSVLAGKMSGIESAYVGGAGEKDDVGGGGSRGMGQQDDNVRGLEQGPKSLYVRVVLVPHFLPQMPQDDDDDRGRQDDL